jgi:hypothetical protein
MPRDESKVGDALPIDSSLHGEAEQDDGQPQQQADRMEPAVVECDGEGRNVGRVDANAIDG